MALSSTTEHGSIALGSAPARHYRGKIAMTLPPKRVRSHMIALFGKDLATIYLGKMVRDPALRDEILRVISCRIEL
jgi:hypothetical protein